MAENLKVQIDFEGDSSKLRQQLESLAAAMGSLRKKTESYTKANNKLKKSNKAVGKQIQSLKKKNSSLINANKKLKKAYLELIAAQDIDTGSKKRNSKATLLGIRNQRLLGNAFATVRSKLLLASFAASLFMGSIGKLTRISGEQEKAERRLSQAIGGTSTRLLDHASALQEKTTFGDEEIIAAQASLAQYTNEEEKIKQLTEATLDFATAKGMDLQAASELVGKSIGSSTNALQRYGIHVEGAVGSQERFNIAMESLTKEGISGQASAEAETFSGKMVQAKNIFGDVAELLGEQLIPFVEKAVDWFVKWGKNMLEQGETWNKFKLAIKGILAPFRLQLKLVFIAVKWFRKFWESTESLRTSIGKNLTPVFTVLSNVLSQVLTIIGSVGKTLGSLLVGDFEAAKEAAHEGAVAISNFTLNIEEGSVQAENMANQIKFVDEATGGLITDLENLDETLGKVNKKEEDNKNKLDDKNKALLNQALLMARIKTQTSSLAEKQAFLNQTTLFGELEHKSYVKTLSDFNKATEQNIRFTEARTMAELEAFINRTFQNEEERERLLEMIRLQKELNDTVVSGMITDKEARQQQIAGLTKFGQTLASLKPENKSFALLGVRLAQIQAVADAYAAFNAYIAKERPGLAAMALAQGLANAAVIEKQMAKVKSAALGANFVTQGEQFLRVGDNPSGREHVQVTPLGNSGTSGGGSRSVSINIGGNILGTQEFVRDTLIPEIENTIERNLA